MSCASGVVSLTPTLDLGRYGISPIDSGPNSLHHSRVLLKPFISAVAEVASCTPGLLRFLFHWAFRRHRQTGGNMIGKFAALLCAGLAGFALLTTAAANAQTQLQVYGLWHCSPDACSWASVPNMT